MDIKIQYNGRFPNLCSGNLTVVVDGVSWEFPKYCLVSGGGASLRTDEVWKGPWSIYEWPENFQQDLKESVLEAINKHIPLGCCGGCL